MIIDPEIEERQRVEKFSEVELASLRMELTQAGLDSWQAAQVLSSFLAGRGYGVNHEHARKAVSRLEMGRWRYESLQAEIEKLAWVM
jgi:hypothetical protein